MVIHDGSRPAANLKCLLPFLSKNPFAILPGRGGLFHPRTPANLGIVQKQVLMQSMIAFLTDLTAMVFYGKSGKKY
jgi:hypothetical protein